VVELTVVILLFVHATGLSIKTAFNLVKINLLFQMENKKTNKQESKKKNNKNPS
jgi:hypothetical protein